MMKEEVAYFGVLSQHSDRSPEENHGKDGSRQPVTCPRFEGDTEVRLVPRIHCTECVYLVLPIYCQCCSEAPSFSISPS
jgi:hypothetical protein